MTQHTGGEWYVERIHKMKCGTPIDSDIWAVKSTQKTRYNDSPQSICSFDWGTPAGKANAQLIAAAPELLDILEAAVARIQIANEEGDCILSAWLNDARAAIAKAKGEK